MAALNQNITEKVAGDGLRIQDSYIELPTGITVVKAYLAVKEQDYDVDGDAIIFKEITTALTLDGQITDPTSSGDLAIALFFDLAPEETSLLEPITSYHYGIRVITNDGVPYTCVQGRIQMERGVVQAAS